MPRSLSLIVVLSLLPLAGCVDPTSLEGLVVALPPSTPDNFNVQPIIVKAPLNEQVKYRYEWETDSATWMNSEPDWWGDRVMQWDTRPGETWTVRVIPYVGRADTPLAEGPAADATTLITDAGRDSDNDGDGSTENQGDCDDTDPTVFPGVDRDGDGFLGCLFPFQDPTTLDCDDTDSMINPGQVFDRDDSRPLEDEDCDGLIDEDAIVEGDFVITEVMLESATAGGEWVEILHLGTAPRDLVGWQLLGEDDDTLPSVQVEGAERFVLCPNPSTAGDLGVPCANEQAFASGVLAGDGLRLIVPETRIGALVLQDVPLGELPFGVGASAQLDAGASASSTAAEDAARWCLSTTSFGDELGTPGGANESCPAPLTGE